MSSIATTHSIQKLRCSASYENILKLLGENYEGLGDIYKSKLVDMKRYGKRHQLYYVEVNVESVCEDTLKQVIGKDGCYFKLTTEKYDLDFIWHDRNNQKILVWGPRAENIMNGLQQINFRIHKYSRVSTPPALKPHP